jgi:hypothetical protein
MTPEQAFCVVVWRGLVPLELVRAEHIARWPWFDDRCELVLVASHAAYELSHPRTVLELAKCVVADGYSIREAADIAVEVMTPLDAYTLDAARRWLLEQAAEVAA